MFKIEKKESWLQARQLKKVAQTFGGAEDEKRPTPAEKSAQKYGNPFVRHRHTDRKNR